MANLYDGKSDSRQGGDIKPSRFRQKYRALEEPEVALHDEIKGAAEGLCSLIESIKDGSPSREKSLAITKLEESVMWAIKGLTS